MIHLDKLPTELFYLLAPSLTAFELIGLLIVCPRSVSFHQLRRGCYVSKQDRLVGLIQALCVGEIELVQQIPQLPQLLEDFDNFAKFSDMPDDNRFFGGNELLAKSVARTSLNGYINPLVVAINQSSSWPPEQRLPIIQHLLDNGARTDIWDKFQCQQPLYVATENKDNEAVSLLLRYQASQYYPSRKGQHWRHPLDAAIEQDHIGLVSLFIKGPLKTRPFHMPALKRRVKSVQSMEILNMLITQKRYRITDEELLNPNA
ncbi:hypothetical protein BDV25DRAFT_141191 [Aspergillus avenaceus]|uniref:Uncharacterized protein n=1 Tax=Aspergillus avenaceus TaxID=36643 RepID=A0A5N6TS92_ASPAV|nr:hypothetical protein BDV25DRAFT_141191 [Aspergillus avenaceus]